MTIDNITTLINTITDGGKNTALTVRTVLNGLKDQLCMVGEEKMIKVNLTTNPSFFIDNFDSTGLGISELYLGFALCNGNNGTDNNNGRVPVGYDKINYPTPGTMGGSKDSVLPSHFHYQYVNEVNTGGAGVGTVTGTKGVARSSSGKTDFNYEMGYAGVDNVDSATLGRTSTSGTSATNGNMQPYIVKVFIQRVA